MPLGFKRTHVFLNENEKLGMVIQNELSRGPVRRNARLFFESCKGRKKIYAKGDSPQTRQH